MKRDDHLGRRNFYRLKATYHVSYRARIGNNFNCVLTKDISAGGMLIMSEQNFPKGTEIDIIIRLPMYLDKQIKALGEVTSDFPAKEHKPLYPTRIRFVEFDEIAFKKLKDFIEDKMNKNKDGQSLKEKIDRRSK